MINSDDQPHDEATSNELEMLNEKLLNPSEIYQDNGSSSKVSKILESVEMLALQKGGKGTLDFSRLNPQQIDKVLDTMHKNEENAFAYHTKKLDTLKEIRFKELDNAVIDRKTSRWVKIGGLLGLVLITLLILYYKEKYFIPWLTFITGLAGGIGLSKTDILKKPKEIKSNEDDL